MSSYTYLPDAWDYDYLMHGVWDKYADARVLPFMVGGPVTFVHIVGAYLLFVLVLGPWAMRNHKPFELRRTIMVYNALNVLLNGAFFVDAMILTNGSLDCWGCRDTSDLPGHQRYIRGILYAWLKIYDLLDTVFFVLRKKDRQVTTLHVVHHSVMPFTVFLGVKFVPNAASAMTMIANSLVHTAMYTYYFVAALGSPSGQLIRFKKTITRLQLAQFAIVGTHGTHLLLMARCDYPRWIATLEMFESSYFMYHFAKFYVKTYLKKKTGLELKGNGESDIGSMRKNA